MKILDLHKNDRPREKLQIKGPKSLSDFELLQALIGSGNKQADVSQIAKKALDLIRAHRAEVSYEQLDQISGLGPAKITEILAALELSKRYLLSHEQPIINCTEAAVAQLTDIRNKKQEYFVALTLDGASRLIAKRTITIGTLNKSLVHPREVFADAITDRAAHIIVAHNHPSGGLAPSKADRDVTMRLVATGKILGINLIDHIVVTKAGWKSIPIDSKLST
ncbi:MAG TPA: DNA repair protein RadC [Candidatus Saccharimonadales bacterium]|nr:DNA repair protein RadC [Candidatus Saccharimonadales bacterium]